MRKLHVDGERGRWAHAGLVALTLAVLVAGCGSRRSVAELEAGAAGLPLDRAAGAVPGAETGVPAGDSTAPGSVVLGTQTEIIPGVAVPTGKDGKPAPKRMLSPIKIGTVGTMSGIGGTQRGSVTAMQAWAKWVNARGGIAGHPVELIVVDDGSDPARHRAALQELVERRGVIAFVGNLTGFSLSEGAVEYLESKRIPVIGGDRLNELWLTSPMMFPQASAGKALVWVHMANTARLGGAGAPVGWLTCQEARICRDAAQLWPGYAQQLGLEVKYSAQVSVGQLDFTAECIRAQQAGVKYFLLGTDANSIRRIGASCAQQGYHPRYAVLQTSDQMALEEGLDGGYYGSSTFPWVGVGSPAMREFKDVVRKFAPGLVLSAHSSSGWVAARLFERAAAGVGEPPTTQQILDGLWSIENETLGGLTSPLTFRRGGTAVPRFCYFPMEIRRDAWVSTNGERILCTQPPKG